MQVIVVEGDSLWKITQLLCGDGQRWKELHNANRQTVKDPTMVYPGQRLQIPATLLPPIIDEARLV